MIAYSFSDFQLSPKIDRISLNHCEVLTNLLFDLDFPIKAISLMGSIFIYLVVIYNYSISNLQLNRDGKSECKAG